MLIFSEMYDPTSKTINISPSTGVERKIEAEHVESPPTKSGMFCFTNDFYCLDSWFSKNQDEQNVFHFN